MLLANKQYGAFTTAHCPTKMLKVSADWLGVRVSKITGTSLSINRLWVFFAFKSAAALWGKSRKNQYTEAK